MQKYLLSNPKKTKPDKLFSTSLRTRLTKFK